jgi:dTDP-4-dehydrorhamnose 3,5-epimerase
VYNSKAESGVRWDDPQVAIDWPVKEHILSEKDRTAEALKEWLSRPESAYLRV